MTLQAVGSSLLWPLRFPPGVVDSANLSLGATPILVLDAAADEVYLIGTVVWSDGGTHTINKIRIFTGAVTFGASSVLRIGQQTLLTTTVLPRRGDGTFVHSGTVAAAGVSANAVVQATISGWTSVASGTEVCIAVKISTFTAGDSVALKNFAVDNSQHSPTTTINNAGVYTAAANAPRLLLIDDAGYYGIFDGAGWYESATTRSWNTGSTFDEVGNAFQVPFKCSVRGAWIEGYLTINGDAQLKLYTLNASLGVSSTAENVNVVSQLRQSTARLAYVNFAAEQTLSPGTTYGLTLLANNANNVNVIEIDIGTAAYAAALPGGTTYRMIERDGSTGDFVATADKYMTMGLLISALDDGAASGGAIVMPATVLPGIANYRA